LINYKYKTYVFIILYVQNVIYII
ncbi:hypothetical protein, partial [Plasmodium yoelii yoelii]